MIVKLEWCKSDKEALAKHTNYEFIEIIKPYRQTIKPYDKVRNRG
jgi:hypothetical protein